MYFCAATFASPLPRRMSLAWAVSTNASRSSVSGVVSPFGGPTSSGMLTLHCPPGEVHALATFLREHGAESVIVADIEYVFTRDNPLFAKLEAAVRTAPRI